MMSKETWRSIGKESEKFRDNAGEGTVRASSRDGKSRSARKFVCGAPLDSNISKFGKSFSKPLENQICSFCQINKDSNCKWQTISDALTSVSIYVCLLTVSIYVYLH